MNSRVGNKKSTENRVLLNNTSVDQQIKDLIAECH